MHTELDFNLLSVLSVELWIAGGFTFVVMKAAKCYVFSKLCAY